jgi:hypothetical protein
MTGTNCDLFTHKSSRSYLNHLVQKINIAEANALQDLLFLLHSFSNNPLSWLHSQSTSSLCLNDHFCFLESKFCGGQATTLTVVFRLRKPFGLNVFPGGGIRWLMVILTILRAWSVTLTQTQTHHGNFQLIFASSSSFEALRSTQLKM